MAQEQTKRGGGGDEDDVTDLGGPAGQERREKLAE
ncbi:MAG: ubiquitin-like protein Pup, partial [Mycobacterium sp.]